MDPQAGPIAFLLLGTWKDKAWKIRDRVSDAEGCWSICGLLTEDGGRHVSC